MHYTSLQLILIDYVPSQMQARAVTLIVANLLLASYIRLGDSRTLIYGPASYSPLCPSQRLRLSFH